ncbi:hypothetical protein EDB86DRAFT_2816711 [Lactarius hatsudake]|nr:hypothetical protein EDB86DRAFT_2816711 [Lactarius hatsudake]
MSFFCSFCGDSFRSQGGLTKHVNSKHRKNSTLAGMAAALQSHTFIRHPHLSAHPCLSDGTFLRDISQPPTLGLLESHTGNPWHPFGDRLAYEWARYHYVKLQSSAADVQQGLDLWRATVLMYQADPDSCDGVPWKSATEMYGTIDSIPVGGVSWTTYQLSYSGPQPTGTLPQWMQEMYELNVRDVLSVFEEQLALKEFDGDFEYTPYEEYNEMGSCVYSNLMSGIWAFREADMISQDKKTHGAMFVPIIAGSDKTTVSVATGHQEYHPVYASLGNITNTARRAHRNGVVPVAFLPIPKSTEQTPAKKTAFQMFCRQLYHSCLELVFAPLKPYMTEPKVMKCPDGHFCHTIFGLGPYIADYPKQVYLSGIVSTWCPKCDALPTDLDGSGSHHRSHIKTDLLIKTFNPGVLWDNFGLRHNIVPFTYSFPRADIHELLAPDLLHQLIKGVFKDHLVEWVLEYLHLEHGETAALDIIEDIDRWISAVPPFPGLRRFPDGCDYQQWTGDDSKALMKVFLAAITGYIPSAMVRCIAAFMDACYIARRNAVDSPSLERLRDCVETFHQLRTIFIEVGVRITLSLPRQHALKHFYPLHRHLEDSGALWGPGPPGLPSGLGNNSTRHIYCPAICWMKARRNKRLRLRKRHATRRRRGISTARSSYGLVDIQLTRGFEAPPKRKVPSSNSSSNPTTTVLGMSQVRLACRSHIEFSERGYPSRLNALAMYIQQPKFPLVLAQFLYKFSHPDELVAPSTIDECPAFEGAIKVHHSAIATFYAPSDLSGSGGLWRERIRSAPHFFGYPRRDTVFVVVDDSQAGMEAMEIGRVLLFFLFEYWQKSFSCVLINWFVHTDERDPDTGMWVVKQELDRCGQPTLEVIHVDSIARAAHLLPVYGDSRVPENFHYHCTLDSYCTFFVNHYVDHHAHEFIGRN